VCDRLPFDTKTWQISHASEAAGKLLPGERLQTLAGDLRHRAGGTLLLHLFIHTACFAKLGHTFIERGQQELRRALADRDGGVVDELLIELDGWEL